MNKEFSRIITHLRKTKGLSQKKVSHDLGISQALLSHYEKGIRECGLDFLVKIADYYDVSVDYLLGRTPNKDGGKISPDDIPDIKDVTDINQGKTDNYNLINRKIITNSAGVIYSILGQIGNKRLSKYVSRYFMTAQYNIFRILHSFDENNRQSTFSVPARVSEKYCEASMTLDIIKIKELYEAQGEKLKIDLSEEALLKKYPESYNSLHNLINNSERNITQKFKI